MIPAWLVAVMSGWKGVKGCWPAILVCGGSFAGIQFCISNWHGPALVNVVGGIGSLVALTVFLRFWQPKEIWRFSENGDEEKAEDETLSTTHDPRSTDSPPLTSRQVAYAWMPWALLSAMVFLWGWPAWKEFLNGGCSKQPNALCGISQMSFEVPWLHNVVYRTGPVVKVAPGADRADKPEAARYDFNWLSATGTSIFLAAVLSAFWLRVSPGVFWKRVRPHAVPRPLGTVHNRLHVGLGVHERNTAGPTPRWAWPSPTPAGSIRFLPRCWAGWASR